jgi:hypothetical protein
MITVNFRPLRQTEEEPDTEYRCRIIQEGSLEISPVKPQAIVWVGANNLNKKGIDKEEYFTVPVRRVIRHAQTYLGGGNYGTFGGYDITLLELAAPVPPAYGRPACLPTTTFQDQCCQIAVYTAILLKSSGK